MSPESRTIESGAFVLSIRGVRISGRAIGSGDPVLLLNGLARPMQSWNHLANTLRDRTVITFDGPGVGLSGTPVLPYSMPMLADVAARVLDAVGVEKADVVGFSFGGAVAQQFAVGHPTRVNRLVLMSTSCGVGAVPGRTRDVVRSWLEPSRRSRWPPTNPLGILWQLAAISTWSSIPVLGRIDAPTLLMCGEHDRVVPRANSRLIAARMRDARLVTIEAGHDLQMPGPAAAAGAIVNQFLDPIAGSADHARNRPVDSHISQTTGSGQQG